MLKEALAVSAMLVAMPVAAQDAQTKSEDGGPVQSEATPSTVTPGAPKAVPPVQKADAAASTLPSSRADVASAVTAPAAPVRTDDGGVQAPHTQVAAIVDREFAGYDKNRSGTLEPEEFAAWMTALKVREPDANAGDKPAASWTQAAFSKADADRSKAVTRVELACFFNGTKPSAS